MRLADFLDVDLIVPDLGTGAKREILERLVAPIAAKDPEFDAESALSVLLERESLGTTGIGDGVAIPHGKLKGLTEIRLVAARSLEGVDFDALDFKKCTIFFLVLAPEDVAGMHLRILAHISRKLQDASFRVAFMSAPDAAAILDLLS